VHKGGHKWESAASYEHTTSFSDPQRQGAQNHQGGDVLPAGATSAWHLSHIATPLDRHMRASLVHDQRRLAGRLSSTRGRERLGGMCRQKPPPHLGLRQLRHQAISVTVLWVSTEEVTWEWGAELVRGILKQTLQRGTTHRSWSDRYDPRETITWPMSSVTSGPSESYVGSSIRTTAWGNLCSKPSLKPV
jgi:hypothetical protein